MKFTKHEENEDKRGAAEWSLDGELVYTYFFPTLDLTRTKELLYNGSKENQWNKWFHTSRRKNGR